MVIKLGVRKIFTGFIPQMLTCDLFVVANLLCLYWVTDLILDRFLQFPNHFLLNILIDSMGLLVESAAIPVDQLM